MGSIYRQQGRKNWIIKYYRAGQPIVEHTGTDDWQEARRTLRNRETDVDRGVPVGPTIGRVRWEDAVKDLETDYSNSDQGSLDDVQRRLALHLTPVFAGRRLSTITTAEIQTYVATRRTQTYRARKAV